MQQWAAWTLNIFGTFWSLFLTKSCPVAIAYKLFPKLSGTECLMSDQSANVYVPIHSNSKVRLLCKEWTARCAGQKCFVRATSERKRSGSKCLNILISHFLSSWHSSVPSISFKVNAVYGICETRCGRTAFSFDEFVQKDTSPTFKCQKISVSLTCTSRIVFFSMFIRKCMKTTAFRNIF